MSETPWRFSARVEIQKPTQEQVQAIQSKIVERLATSVQNELDALQAGGHEGMMDTHDKHDSFHSKG